MKLQLLVSTAAVLFSAFSGSVSAASLRGVAITSDSADSADYYFPEGEGEDYDEFDYDDEDEDSFSDSEDMDMLDRNYARERQQINRFGRNSGRPGSRRWYNTRTPGYRSYRYPYGRGYRNYGRGYRNYGRAYRDRSRWARRNRGRPWY